MIIGGCDHFTGIDTDIKACYNKLINKIHELVSGFLFSTKTKRLSASSYKKPKVKNNIKTKIITLETLEEVTNDLSIIKKEYYQYKLSKVFEELIKEISKN